MNTFLVKIKHPKFRENLVEQFEKVGQGKTMPDFVIVQTDKDISTVRSCEGVVHVELDSAAEPQYIVEAAEEDIGWAIPWMMTHPKTTTGKGVDIYVVDTGVRDTHVELKGRVRNLYSFDAVGYSEVGGASPTHGTSVAACAAGTKYGTAPDANIVNCRIDFGSMATIIQAVDTILLDHLAKPDNIPSIVNFSGSSESPFVGEIFERLTQYGVVVIAASGNYTEAIPRYPARNSWIMSVGAINQQELPATFTNRKSDLYAGGRSIRTAGVNSDTETILISGTSFSAPYGGGLLGCLLEGSDKFNTSSQVSEFNHQMRNEQMQQGRIESFPNGGLPVRTASTKPLGRVYYENPLKKISDNMIATLLMGNLHNLQDLADGCRQLNLSLSRIVRALGGAYTAEQINLYFSSNNVTPWWHVG
jgi:subtilisin family serine protease